MRAVSIQDGRVQFDPRDGSAATALIHGITRKLLLQPGDAGAYGIEFSLDRDRARIKNLRMNSRWYGLRGHGDVSFDSRLDLMAEGGPVQRVENEFSAAGDVLGEITETLLRAHVTGTLGEPTVGIEALRHPLR